jgi:hypothetical protein
MRVQTDEAPGRAEKVKDAIALIAEARDSARLRKFLEIGVDRECSVLFTAFASCPLQPVRSWHPYARTSRVG